MGIDKMLDKIQALINKKVFVKTLEKNFVGFPEKCFQDFFSLKQNKDSKANLIIHYEDILQIELYQDCHLHFFNDQKLMKTIQIKSQDHELSITGTNFNIEKTEDGYQLVCKDFWDSEETFALNFLRKYLENYKKNRKEIDQKESEPLNPEPEPLNPEDSETLEYTYYKNGSVKDEKIFDGEELIISRTFHKNGQLADEIFYKNGVPHGVRTQFNENGVLQKAYSLVNGENHGLYKSYFYDGSPSVIANYVNGKYHGVYQQFFYEDGSIQIDAIYDMGKKVKYEEYVYNPENIKDVSKQE